jgi:predicted esterase
MESNSKSILFLHGYTQNSLVFQKRLKVLTKAIEKLFPDFKLIFPDAPFELELETPKEEEEIKRAWLYLNEKDKMNTDDLINNSELNYLGLETSLQKLMSLNEENNLNIECIFAFSQGSLVATLLSILISHGEYKKYFPNLKCIVLVAGFIFPFPINEEVKFYLQNLKKLYTEEALSEEEKIQIPSLHVYGSADVYILPEKSQKLSHLFANSEQYEHKGKHFIPTGKDDLEVFLNFLKKYLNK